MVIKPIKSRLQQATRFVYVMRGERKLQTFQNFGNDYRAMHAKACSALSTWCNIYPPDSLSLWATDEEWKR